MFDKNIEDRLRAWYDFRQHLETDEQPFKSTVELYNTAPISAFCIDPYTPENWPTPWELLEENKYDEFGYILGIGYTLGLTERFSNSVKEIHITQDKDRSTSHYLFFVDDDVIGYDRGSIIKKENLPDNLIVESVYSLPDEY